MYLSNMELHVIIHYLPLLLALFAVEAFETNSSEADSTRASRSSRRTVRLYSGKRPEPITCLGEGFQSDPVNCAVFYRCMKSGRGRFMSFKFQCAPGTIFDPVTEVCNHPSAVKRSNCGIDHIISINEQMDDNAIEDIKQELPSPISTKSPLNTKRSSTYTEYPWLTPSQRQDMSTTFPWLPSTHNQNKPNSISTELQKRKTSSSLTTGQFLSSALKQRSTTPRASRKPSSQNGDLCTSEGFMGDSENCRKFYRCINNLRGGYIRYEFMCTESTIWDEDIQSCNHAWAVKKRRCGRGNINDISNEGKINQDISRNPTTSEVTPNVNLVQHTFLASQTQSSISFETKNPLTKAISTTATAKSPTTPNYIFAAKRADKRTTLQSQENDGGYNNVNTDNEPLSSTECSETGFMGDKNDCKKFYRCVDNGKGSYTKYEFVCGEGTVWDANIEACNHVWAVKQCGGSTQNLGTSTLATSNDTTNPSTKSTPLYITTSHTTIDDIDDIGYGNQNPTTTKSPTSTITTQVTKQPGSNCISSGFVGDNNDCKIFYRCVDNGDGSFTEYQFTCGEGTVWDPNLEACNHIWAVNKCGGTGTTKTPIQGTSATTTLNTGVSTSESTQSSPSYISTAQSTMDKDDNTGYDNQNQETISTITEPPSSFSTQQPGNICNSSGFMGDKNDCKKFYRCVDKGNGDYIRYEFSCGEGTVWDPEIQACNHPWAVQTCGGSSSLTTEKYENPTTVKETYTTQLPGLTQNDISNGGYGVQNDESSSPPEDIFLSSTTLASTNQPLNSGNNCISSGFMGDTFDCKKFYRCVDNGNGGFTRYEFTCGEGTVWDPTIQSCNHAWAVEKCGGNLNNDINKEDIITSSGTMPSPSSTTTTSNENEIEAGNGQTPSQSTSEHPAQENEVSTNDCKVSGFMADKKNCKKFFRCVDNGNNGFTRYEFICGEGTIWDQEIQACNHDNGRSCTEQSNESITKEPENNNSVENLHESLPTTNSIHTTTTPTFTESNQIQSSTDTANDTCISDGFYANSKDCKIFYRCVSNGKGGYTKYEFTCGDGTMWVQDIQACDHQVGDSYCSSYTTKPQQSEDQQPTTGQQSSSATSVSIVDSTEKPHDEYQDTSSNIPTQENDSCLSEGFYPNKMDCTKFYRCVDSGQGTYTKYDFSCGEGTAWDTDIQTCNHITEVARCHSESQEASQNKPMQDEGVSQTSENYDSATPKTTTESSESNQISSSDSCESEGYFGNKQDCKKFYRCVDNGKGGYTKYDFDCGEGTIWDQDITTCNHPQDVVNPSCKQQSGTSSSSTSSTQSSPIDNTSQQTNNCSQENTSSQESTTKKPISQNVTCEKAGYYANPNDCKKFYRCVDWDGNGEKFSVYHFECGEGTIWDPNLDTCNHEESVYPPRNCSGIQSQNENNLQESSTDSSPTSQQTTESTTGYSTITEQSTTTEKSMSEETTTQTSTTSEHTTTQETVSQQSTTTKATTTEKTTQPSTTSEITTTEQQTTTDGTTTHQSSTTESSTTQQSTTTTEDTTTPQMTTTEETQSTTENATQSTASESTMTQQTTTTESKTESTTSTDESTTQQSTTSQTSTTDSSESSTTDSYQTTESSTTESSQTTESSTTDSSQTTEGSTSSGESTESQSSTTESSSTEGTSSDKECPDTDEDQYLYVCPTSFRRHPKYCNMFYQCTEDDDNHEPKIAVFTCPNNTIYDESKTQCVEENKAEKKCNGQIAQRRRIKRLEPYYKEPIVVGMEKYFCSSAGYYPFEKASECSPVFFKCQKQKSGHLRGYVHQCPEGYLYWSISKRCEKKENLRDCKTSSNDWSRRWEIPVERKNIAL